MVLTEQSFEDGQRVLAARAMSYRKAHGQYLTPPPLATFAANQLGVLHSGDRILDPAIGSGTLACAIIDRLIVEGKALEIWLEGYETDERLGNLAQDMLRRAALQAATKDIVVHWQVHHTDFIIEKASQLEPTLFTQPTQTYTHIIANPPYFKLPSRTPSKQATAHFLKGHTNIYTLFMALAAKLLAPQGRAVFIVPRSFCSGDYFAAFRHELIQSVKPISVHVLDSRHNNFLDVLQEHIVFSFQRNPTPVETITISSSQSLEDLNTSGRQVPIKAFLAQRKGKVLFRLPISEQDEQIVEAFEAWTHHLSDYGLEVSTGPIVAFRLREFISENGTIPLLWLHNIKRHHVLWQSTNHKPQWFLHTPQSERWLVETGDYVLIRRFSAKEEPRRLVAAPFLADSYTHQWVGLENHLNYIHRHKESLTAREAIGLSAFYNSGVVDRYFRIANGNTQVNAAELRVLPLPPLQTILRIGEALAQTTTPDIDEWVVSILKADGLLPRHFPIIRETRTA